MYDIKEYRVQMKFKKEMHLCYKQYIFYIL